VRFRLRRGCGSATGILRASELAKFELAKFRENTFLSEPLRRNSFVGPRCWLDIAYKFHFFESSGNV
jgi:hypothetical protein